MADSVRSMLTAYTTAQWTANCLSHSSSHRSDSQIFVENRDFCLPHLHSTPPLGGGSCRNIAMTFGMEKLEWYGYPTVKNFEYMFIRFKTDSMNLIDRRTDRVDTTRRHRTRLCIASRSQNDLILCRSRKM